MTTRSGFYKLIGGAAITGALTLTSVFGGVALADNTDINIGVGELQECTISKSMDVADGDVDGRDFLVWQRGAVPAAEQLTDQASFSYSKVVFNY